MRESVFNTEVKNSIKEYGGWAYKIPDSPVSRTMGATTFTPEKPCDIIFAYRSTFNKKAKPIWGGIEGKQMKKFESFGIMDIRASQIRNLTEMDKLGAKCFIFLNVRIAKLRGNKHENRLIIFKWPDITKVLRYGCIGKDDIERAPHIKGKNGLFDLRDFLEELCE